MPPRDMWDLNPVYTIEFAWAYMDLLAQLGYANYDDEEEIYVDSDVDDESSDEEET